MNLFIMSGFLSGKYYNKFYPELSTCKHPLVAAPVTGKPSSISCRLERLFNNRECGKEGKLHEIK